LKPWLKIIRPVNLLLLFVTQYCVDIFILQPNFNTYGLLFTLQEWQFFLLVLSTMSICAGGYLINDYFDIEIDAVNKPEKQIAGKHLEPQNVFYGYLILSAIGLALGIYLSIVIGNLKFITIFVIIIGLLYLYASTFKRIAFVGNIIVALLAAISVLIIIIFEPSLYQLARPGDYYIAGLCADYIIGISLFAFALTMSREIVKDIQDIAGDSMHNAKTLPVRFGKRFAIFCAILFVLATIGALISIYFNVLSKFNVIYLYYILALSAGLLFICFKLLTAASIKEYGAVSTLLKVAMLAGLGLMPLYYLLEF